MWAMCKAAIILILHTIQENTFVALRVFQGLAQNAETFTI